MSLVCYHFELGHCDQISPMPPADNFAQAKKRNRDVSVGESAYRQQQLFRFRALLLPSMTLVDQVDVARQPGGLLVRVCL